MLDVSTTKSAAVVMGSRSLRSEAIASRRLTSPVTRGCLRRVFGVALEQHFHARVQIQNLAADAAAPQFTHESRNRLDFIGPIARIQTDRGSGIGISHAADGV